MTASTLIIFTAIKSVVLSDKVQTKLSMIKSTTSRKYIIKVLTLIFLSIIDPIQQVGGGILVIAFAFSFSTTF